MSTMQKLANHPTMQLRDDAAASWDRFERDHGVHVVTSAYRSAADQQKLIDRWNAGGKYNRPPYLYEPASLAVTKHTKGTGLDTPNAETVAKTASAYGWRFLYAYDLVHLEYDRAYDRHIPATVKPKRATLRRGSRGQAVRDLQSILNKYHGARLTVDGVYGQATINAVVAVQRRAKLSQDGITGPQTWRALGQ